MAGRILENAIVRLLTKRPFYGSLLAALRKSGGSSPHPLGIIICGGIPTLAVDETLLSSYPLPQPDALAAPRPGSGKTAVLSMLPRGAGSGIVSTCWWG